MEEKGEGGRQGSDGQGGGGSNAFRSGLMVDGGDNSSSFGPLGQIVESGGGGVEDMDLHEQDGSGSSASASAAASASASASAPASRQEQVPKMDGRVMRLVLCTLCLRRIRTWSGWMAAPS